jgi:hypothetical protein
MRALSVSPDRGLLGPGGHAIFSQDVKARLVKLFAVRRDLQRIVGLPSLKAKRRVAPDHPGAIALPADRQVGCKPFRFGDGEEGHGKFGK